MSQSPERARFRAKMQATMTPVIRLVVEQIDSDYYQQGTRDTGAMGTGRGAVDCIRQGP